MSFINFSLFITVLLICFYIRKNKKMLKFIINKNVFRREYFLIFSRASCLLYTRYILVSEYQILAIRT